MLKSRFLRSGLVMFLFGTFGLFSCSQTAAISSNGNPTEQTGSIEVTLPDLSKSALSKSDALLDTNSLNLIITGANMDTIKYSWQKYNLYGQKVLINGIPAGANRNFSGYLTDKRGIVTHTGKVSATITPGVIVPLTLKLSATGSVDLCIEIEGYPSSCSGTDTIVVNTCAEISAYSGLLNGKISLTATQLYVNGYIEFTDTIYKRFTIVKLVEMKDSLGYKYCEFAGYCKETGINAQYVMMIKGATVVNGYIYNVANKQLIYKLYSVECTQPDTTVLYGKLNGYSASTPQDTLMATIYMGIYNGNAQGYLDIYNVNDSSKLHLNLFGTGKVSSDKLYGNFYVTTPDTTGCNYILGMSFSKSGEDIYCKGSLDRKGISCSSGPVAVIYGNLR
jgi:hypothetical protein